MSAILTVTGATFQDEVLNSTQPVLVDFYATWCGHCQMLSIVLEKTASVRSDIKFVKVNVDDDMALAEKYDISTIPTLFLVKNGEIVNRFSGSMNKAQLNAFLEG